MKKIKNSLLLWVMMPVAAWLMLYGLVASRLPWNSDFVSIILAVKEIFKSKIYLSPDTFLIKYPIILFLNNWVEYGRKYMWLLQMANGIIMAVGYAWYFADFAKRFVDKKISGAVVAVSLFYMATMSFAFYGFTVHPFLRNAEIALMFLFLVIFRKSKRWSFPILILMLLNDAYFTFVFVIPLILCGIIAESVRKRDLSVNKGAGWLTAGTFLAYVLRDRLINHTGYFLIFEEQAAFQSWKGVQATVPLIQESLINLVGGNFLGLKFYSIEALTTVTAIGLAILALAGLVKLFIDGIKKSQPEMILPLMSSVITVIISLISTKFENLESGRYLIIICFWLPFGILYWLSSIRQIKRLLLATVLATLVISGLKAKVIMAENQKNDFWRDNFYHLELVNFLRQNDLKYGYAGFWSSGISTFLAKDEVKIRQGGCDWERIGAQTWVVSDKWYKPEYFSGSTFILLGAYGNDRNTFSGCNEKTLLKQFGKAKKILEFEKDKIYVYDFNAAEKF